MEANLDSIMQFCVIHCSIILSLIVTTCVIYTCSYHVQEEHHTAKMTLLFNKDLCNVSCRAMYIVQQTFIMGAFWLCCGHMIKQGCSYVVSGGEVRSEIQVCNSNNKSLC